ncbi:MAG: TonB-dependent receptor [Saprospiraceae bacterium]|nr:TonB-dependent receptor [Saprospiraceae bacterium]
MKHFFCLLFCLLLGSFSSLFAQSGKLSGKVTGSDGSPLVGATVLVKGTTNGATTDANGVFILANVATGTPLMVSYVGHTTIEIVAADNLSISLTEGAALEEIIVTADKREESIQKTSMSISAIKGITLRENGLTSVDQILRDVPNVNVQGAARGFVIAMRGIGSDLPPGVGESSVSTNYDGIYNFRAEAGTLGLYDMERVEALRGPQATLYGRNATGGVVNFISKDPTNKLEGYGSVERGSYNLLRLEGAVNVPLSDKISVRTSFANVNRDGYLSNGQNDAVGSGVRTKLKFSPSDDVTIKLNYEFNKLGGKGPGFTPYSTYSVYEKSGVVDSALYNPTTDNQQQTYVANKVWADMSFNVGPGVISLIPAYQHAKGKVWGDNGRGLSSSLDPKSAIQKSFEARYGAKAGSKINWVAGFYYYDLENNIFGNGPPPAVLNTDKTKSSSVFGQVTIPVASSFRALVGARYASDTKSYIQPSNNPSTAEKNWKAFDWKVGLEADLAENSMAYLTVATGHRAGGFNSFPGGGGKTFNPESLISYELGTKNKLADNRLLVNAALFYYNYKGFQVADFFFPPGSPFPVLELTNHDVINRGLELETKYAASRNTNLKFNFTYLKSTYNEDFVLHGGPLDGPDPLQMNGKTLPHAPGLTLNVGIDHSFVTDSKLRITPSISYRHNGEQWVAPFLGASQYQKGFSIIDVSVKIAAPNGRVSLNAYARNASNYVQKIAFFGDSALTGAPRQIGLVLSAMF